MTDATVYITCNYLNTITVVSGNRIVSGVY